MLEALKATPFGACFLNVTVRQRQEGVDEIRDTAWRGAVFEGSGLNGRYDVHRDGFTPCNDQRGRG